MQETNKLKQMSFFKNVGEETLDRIWQQGKVKKCEAKECLFRGREKTEYIYFQLSGKSMLYNLTHDGRRKIFFILGKNSLLNDHVVNTHENSFYCEVLEISLIFRISVKIFLEEMGKDFELVKAVLTAQECKMWRLGHQLKNTHGSIYLERKLAAKLWKLARDFGENVPEGRKIDIKLSVTFLADMLGAPRESTSKACKSLVKNGLIRMEKKTIIIISPKRMAQFYKGTIGDVN